MKKWIFTLSITALMACGPERKSADVHNSLFETVSDFPELSLVKIDSVYLENLESEYQNLRDLEPDLVSKLFDTYQKPKTTLYHNDNIESFLEIDSLKKSKAYENYVNNLDIGMLKDAKSFELGFTKFNENVSGLYWGIWHTSFEACPFYHGVDIYISFFNNGNLESTIKIGSNFSAADAPSMIYAPIYSSLVDEKVTMEYQNFEFDIDTSEELPTNWSSESFVFNLNKLDF